MIWLAANWKYLAGLLVLGGIFAAGAHWQSGRDVAKAARVAATQATRDAIAAATFQTEVSKRETAEQNARDANERIYDDLQPKLDAAAADSTRLARLLHNAISASARRDAADKAPDHAGTPDTTGVPDSTQTLAGPVERAAADAFAACDRDSMRLAALQAEVRAQL